MEFTFLLSDVPVAYGHQLLRNPPESENHIFVFLKDFEKLEDLQKKFPDVVWLIADINQNLEIVTRFLRVLPTPNYIVNFTGYLFAQNCLDLFQSCGISFKEKERGHSELTLEGIVDDDDGEECRIFVNVVERRSELKKKTKLFRKKVKRLVHGAKFRLSNITQESDDHGEEENTPLMGPSESDESTTSPGFFANLFSLCCPCFVKPPEPEYHFESPEDLRFTMNLEQMEEIQTSFAELHKASLHRWNNVTLLELRRKETQKVEELAAKIEDLKQQEEQQLTSIKDKQNANTRYRLSNVLSEDTIRRIEESRSRQTKGTANYDADRAFREGQSLISKQVAIDRAQFYERHYFRLVEEQLQKLSDIQLKYQRKSQDLHERYFSNRA